MAYSVPDSVSPAALLDDLLAVSLLGISLLRPLYSPNGELNDFALEYFNAAAQRMTGLPEQPGGTARTHFPDLFVNGGFDFYRRVFETSEAGRYDFNYQADGFDNYFHVAARRSGELLVVSFTATADQDRRPVEQARRESQAREQVLARQRLDESTQQLRTLVEHAPFPIGLHVGPDFRIQLANQALISGWGKGRDVIGQPFADVLPELDRQGVTAQLRQVLATGQALHLRNQPLEVVVNGTGQTFYYNYSFTPLRDAHGQVYGILNTAADVTDQALAAQRLVAYATDLQQSEARFRTLADAAPNMVWDLHPDGSVRYVNKYCLAFLGITLEEFVASNWTPYILPEDVAPTEQILGRAIAERGIFSMEHRILRHDKQYRWLLTQGGPSYYATGELYGYVGSAIDIHDLKQANEQLQRTNTDLDNFIYTASHDLKTPISNIEGLLYLLQEELPAEVIAQDRVAPALQMMLDAVERFKRTIEHLTEVSKLQKEHAPVTTSVDLATVVEDVRQDLRPLLEQTHANLLVAIPPLPPVQFSEKNLRSVVYNLLSNALKYRHPGRSLHVDVRAHVQQSFTVLEVHDNGLGIDPIHLPKLFGMFQRFHTHVEGTGIGLYMVKRMVENAGGRLEVLSQLEAGTTILVYLPCTLPA